MKTRHLRLFGFIGCLLLGAAPGFSQISLTLQGHSLGDEDPVSFVFVSDFAVPYTTPGQTDYFASWENSPTTPLFDDISGTGISGLWNPPSNSQMTFWGRNDGGIEFEIGSFPDTGLTFNGEAVTDIMLFYAQHPDFVAGSNPTPTFTEYFNEHQGAFVLDDAFFQIYTDSTSYTFLIDQVDIAALSAVPEPAAFAGVLGGVVLGLAWFVRSRRKLA